MVSLAVMLMLMVPAVGAQSANAMVRVAHASPDAPAVDVYVGGNRVLSNVPFGAVSAYLSLPTGKYAIKVLPAGAAATDKGVIEAEVSVEGGKAYTIAAMGKVAQIGPVVLGDNLANPAAGKAKVRLVHASPDAPAVDVAVKGGPVLFRNVAFKAASDYLEVDAGSYDLEVRPAGTTTVALAVPGVKLEAGTTYSVWALGLLQGQPALKAQPSVDAKAAAGAPAMPRTGQGGTAAAESWTFALAGLLLSLATGAVILRRRLARG
jgi:hypothetical protein